MKLVFVDRPLSLVSASRTVFRQGYDCNDVFCASTPIKLKFHVAISRFRGSVGFLIRAEVGYNKKIGNGELCV